MILSNLFQGLFSSSQTSTPLSISLDGPFLLESEVLEYPDKYADLLEKTWFHTNLIISRDLLITSPDPDFSPRDDLRIEAGITHHAHQIDLFVQDASNFEPIAVDQYVLLNHKDVETVHLFLEKHPLSSSELHSISPTIH